MPPVIAAIATWAGISFGAAALLTAAVVLSAGTAIYGAAQARKAERAARDAMNEAMKDRMVTRIATEAPHRYIYGRAKVGSDIVAMFTSGPKDEFKHLVCVHAAHECDAIEEIWVNNALVEGVNASGDATAGRFAVTPDSVIEEEQFTGPTFVLSYMPRSAESVWVFSGTGSKMQRVAVSSVNGRTVTIGQSGPVTVSYERPYNRRFDDVVDLTVQQPVGNPVVRVQKHLGGASDPADAYLSSVVGDKWPATAVLRGMCYTVITLDLNHPEFQGGLVPIHAVIRGKKLYDPRDGQTRWSQNPALVIMDYLTSPLCAVPMSDLPASQFITAANVCDEASPTGGARYTINGTVTSDQGQASVLEKMTQAMAGGLVATTWDVYAGKFVAPVMALSQSDVVGSLSINPGVSDASVYNGVKGQYIGPENNYVQTDFAPYQNSVYREADGRDLYTNLDFPFTESTQRVTNLARIFTEDQRNGYTLKAEFGLKAWPLKVGQRVTFTSPFFGMNAKTFRVTDKSYAPNSAVQLSLKEDDASIWDYADAVVLDSTPNSDLPDPWKIEAPDWITCSSGESALLRQVDGSTVPRILVTWPAVAQANGKQLEVEWRAVSSTTWERTTVSAEETQAYLSPITPGFFYIVRARTTNPSIGVQSNWLGTIYQVEVFTATPTVYMWAAEKPAPPGGAASYQWPTGAFGAAPAGWSLAIPAAPAGGNVTLWAATVAVSDISAVLSPFDWSRADVLSTGYQPSAAGMGPAGYSNATVRAYQRKATAPAGTPGAVNVDLTTGKITTATLANGWLKAIPPADGNPLYVTEASASSTGTTDAIASNEWSGAVVLVNDGSPGTPGLNSATVQIYQRSAGATAPAKPSAACTYTFATGALTGLNNGWSTYIPTTGGAYLHTTLATASATTATDSIPASEWAAVQLMYDATDLIAAKAAADAANAKAEAIAADGVLDRGEKAAVRKEWGTLYDSERPTLVAQAAALGVSSTAYTDALSLLAQYLEGIGAGSEWANTAVDSTIDRITFNAKFAGVYAAKQALLNAFVSAASRDFASYITWDFRGTLDGWQNIVGISSMSFTADSMIIQSAGYDPIFRSPYGLNIVGALYNVVRMKVKRLAGWGWDGTLFWSTSQYPTEGGAGQGVTIPDTTKSDEWVILEWDLSKVAAWTGRTIQFFRPDLGGLSVDKFEIDWISVGRYGPAVSASELAAAKAAADAANAAIAAFANDYVLDRGEKAQLVREWVQEDAIWSQLRAQADALGVSHINYDNNHKDTSDYLLSLNPSWSDTTQDTAIDREYFKLRFTWLYEARVALQNAIAAKAATTADANSISGMTHFRVLTQGNTRTASMPAGSHGLYRNGVHSVTASRSYTVVAIMRSTGVIAYSRSFDVYGDPAQATAMRDYLNGFSSDVIMVVYSFYEPYTNRTTNGLAEAMYRCGASRAVFGSPEFKGWAAYCLIGIPGCGEGNGAEFYQGSITQDPNAWIDVSFILTNGNYTATAGYTPRSLKDYGYSGDLNATSGAPAGTNVAGVPAETVAAGAQAGNTLNNPPVIGNIASDFTTGFAKGGPAKTVATINPVTTGGKAPYSYTYSLNVLESNDTGDNLQYTVSRSSSGGNINNIFELKVLTFTGGLNNKGTITVTCQDAAGLTSSRTSTFNFTSF